MLGGHLPPGQSLSDHGWLVEEFRGLGPVSIEAVDDETFLVEQPPVTHLETQPGPVSIRPTQVGKTLPSGDVASAPPTNPTLIGRRRIAKNGRTPRGPRFLRPAPHGGGVGSSGTATGAPNRRQLHNLGQLFDPDPYTL